jgi:hypothetical protein
MEQKQELDSDGTLHTWRESQIMKDRSGLLDGKVFKNPTYADLQPFVRYLVDVPTGTVAGETSGRNLAPGENYEGYDRRKKAEIALDDIKEELGKHHGLGTDVATKTAKAETLEKITKLVFQTRNWSRIESFKPEEIFTVRDELWKLTRGHKFGEQPPAAEPANEILQPGANDPPKQDAAA